MATFVLIHGAWHGGWVWEKIVPLLQEHGHNVYYPTLSHTAETTLSDHIDEVCSIIRKENLNHIILVGHSFGGLIIAGVASKMTERIAQLVYLDAIIPENGLAYFDLCPEDRAKKLLEKAQIGLVPSLTAYEYGLESQEDISWASSKYTPQPLKTFTEPLLFDWKAIAKIKKVYIFCTRSTATSAVQKMNVKAREAKWTYFELDTGHSCMITTRKELVDILLKLELQA
ncbi:MAG: Pyrethroid hydrolase [Chlamydiae bacterium]|nr:Pyrethroid hydrolase [Chlamydiota bacterium]